MKQVNGKKARKCSKRSEVNTPVRLGAVMIAVSVLCPGAQAAPPTVTILHSFGATTSDAANPYSNLVLGSDGNFYGTTQSGGDYGAGTVFAITPSGSLAALCSLGMAASDGSSPMAGLVQGSDGNFYGTTKYGGTASSGTVFRITPSCTQTTLHSFAFTGLEGIFPQAGLVQGSDGNFYGTAADAGLYGGGTVFKITPQGTLSTLYSFEGLSDNVGEPYAGLVQGFDGNFYGTTLNGTIFKITPSGLLTTLYSLGPSSSAGSAPFDGLVQGSDGNFYGTTSSESTYGKGAVFKITPSGSLTTLYSFGATANDGASSEAGLVQGSDGNFYGTTFVGGTYNEGTIFRITPSGVLTTLYSFGGVAGDGVQPVAGLAQGADGNFYGTTNLGGEYGEGTVYLLQAGIQATPSAPIGLSASTGNAQAKLTWQASAGASSYNVYEGTSAGGESTTPVLTGLTGTNATVTGLTNGTTYYFEVAAVGPGGASGMSNEAKATPFVLPGKIASLVAQPGKLEALLRWTVAANATSYVVLRSTVPGAEKPVAEGVTTTKYTAARLDAGTTYYFKVAGMNASGIGPNSAEISVTPQ